MLRPNLMQFFEYEHLPEKLQKISREFHVTAKFILENTPDNHQSRRSLEKLLEAKDCAVRAAITK